MTEHEKITITNDDVEFYAPHYYTIHKMCPCKIGDEAVHKAVAIYRLTNSIGEFISEMDRQRVIGKRIWYDQKENTIFITKRYAGESGGGCAENNTIIGERCHCDYYNRSKEFYPKHYCKCGAEFYRPMFAPIFGEDVLIEPYKTVLAGDEECILAIQINKTEGK